MKKGMTVLLLALALSACARKDVIPDSRPDAAGFKFYLFATLNGEKFQGNGDAFLVADKFFKFRVYDNLLSKEVLYFRSGSDGTNRLVSFLDGSDFRAEDGVLSRIMTHYLYALFIENARTVMDDPSIPESLADGPWITRISVKYGESKYVLEVLKRFDNGKPRRISITSGESSVIFDITAFQSYDFYEPNGDFTVVEFGSEGSFFGWLGEAYASQ